MGDAKNSMDGSDGQWKDRYLEIINTLESQQAESQASLELMQRYMKRWAQDCLPADEQRDQAALSLTLDSMQSVRQFLDAVDDCVRPDRATSSASPGDAGHDVWLPLIELLEQQKLPKSLRNEIKQFRQRVTEGYDFSPVVDFETLLRTYLAQQSEGGERRGGLWQRLRKANALEEDRNLDHAVDEAHSPDAVSADVQQDMINQGLDVVRRKINGILYTLIDQVKVPDTFGERKNKLRSDLNQVADWDALPNILSETTSLVFISNSVHQHEFEGFLQGLNAKLAEIHSFLNESRDIESHAVEAAQALDSEVKDSIDGLNAALQDSDNLQDLKKNVQQRLETILNAFDLYKASGAEKRSAVLEKLEKLSDRMEVLEDDSQRLRQVIERQRQDSLKDTLTGLPNRQCYEEQANKEIARVRRQGHKLSLVVADIDHFKSINDNYGHLAGDRVLKLVAQAMVNRLRASDLIARYGGEEFVILMLDTASKDAVYATDQLRAAIAKTKFHYQNQRVNITVSFGVTQVVGDDTLEKAFQRADKALYEAKAGGRNRVCHADDAAQPVQQSPEGSDEQDAAGAS